MINLSDISRSPLLKSVHTLNAEKSLKKAIKEKRAHNLNRLLYGFLNSKHYSPDYDYFESYFPFFLNMGYETGLKKIWLDIYNKLNILDEYYKNREIDMEGYTEYFQLLSNHIYAERMKYRHETYIPCRFGCTKLFLWPGIEEDLVVVKDTLSKFSNMLKTKDLSGLKENQFSYRYLITAEWFLLELGRPIDSIILSELTIPFIKLASDEQIPNIFELEDLHITRYKSSLLWLQVMGYFQLGNLEMTRQTIYNLIEQADARNVPSILNNRFLEASLLLYGIEQTNENREKVLNLENIVRNKKPHEPSEAVRERLLVLFEYYNKISKYGKKENYRTLY